MSCPGLIAIGVSSKFSLSFIMRGLARKTVKEMVDWISEPKLLLKNIPFQDNNREETGESRRKDFETGYYSGKANFQIFYVFKN